MDFCNGKRYNTLDSYYKNRFGKKVFKISLNAGFSCPHSGCIFCSSTGSGEFGGNINDSLSVQFESIKNVMLNKWPDGYYIGYFQARTNTNAPVNILKEKFEEVLGYDNVIGLSIATRPDCISDECLEYLLDLNKRCFLTIELGLQTIFDNTSNFINRGHNFECFDLMAKKILNANINLVVHIINGLPFESFEMNIETIKYINSLGVDGVKIHNLCILDNTLLASLYKNGEFDMISRDEYIKIVCEQLRYLNPNIVVHRLTTDPNIDDLIAPLWTVKKTTILNDIDKYMRENNINQGDKVN